MKPCLQLELELRNSSKSHRLTGLEVMNVSARALLQLKIGSHLSVVYSITVELGERKTILVTDS